MMVLRRFNLVSLAAVPAMAVLGGWIVATAIPGDLRGEWFYLALLAATLAAPLVLRVVQRRFDPFEPLFVFCVVYAVLFVIRPAVMLSSDELAYVRPTATIAFTGELKEVLRLAWLGATAFIVGYELTLRKAGRQTASVRRAFQLETAAAAAALVGLFGASLFGLLVWTSGGTAFLNALLEGRSTTLSATIRSSSLYLWQGPYLLLPASLALLALGRRGGNRGLVLLGATAGLLLLLRSVPTGSRTILMPYLGALALIFYLDRRRRPSAAMLIGLGFLTLFTSALLLQTRAADVDGSATLSGRALEIVRTPTSLADPLTRGADAEMAAALAAALTVIPEEMPHTYGLATLTDFVSRPIPRSVWPSKPRPPRERVIETLWPREYAVRIANPEFSSLLVLYLDGRAIGVTLGLLIIGACWALLYRMLLRDTTDLRNQLIFAATLPFMPNVVRDSTVDSIVNLSFITLPLIFIFWIARGHEAESRSPDRSKGRVS